jgi:hypothetical protein
MKNHEKCQLVQTTNWLRFEKQRLLTISKKKSLFQCCYHTVRNVHNGAVHISVFWGK